MSENFEAFTRRVSGFDGMSPTDKICHAAWFLHISRGSAFVDAGAINSLFSEMHAVPPHTSVYLKRMADKKPPLMIKSKQGYKLESKPRNVLNDKYGSKAQTIQIGKLLSDLVDEISTKTESNFLEETLRCYSVRAFRATIVMVWNLAYSHLTNWIIVDTARLSSFNSSLIIKYPKKSLAIKNWDDFAELKEFEVIEICQHAKLVTKNVAEILKEKLKRRNAAAHPSTVVITQAQTDDVITDLVNNVVLSLA